MALLNQVSSDHSGKQSEEMIAKEVIVKVLIPAVFDRCNLQDGEADLVFDHWYKKLFVLLLNPVLLGNPPDKKEAVPVKEQAPVKQSNIPAVATANNTTVSASDKITDKQLKKIFVVAREKEILKSTIEDHAGCAISQLTKKEASRIIDWLIGEDKQDFNDALYGRAG